LIWVILAFDGKIGEAARENVIEFQKCKLGRGDGDYGVFDLSSLPSQSQSIWKLNEFGFEWLKARRVYEQQILVPRCNHFREKLAFTSRALSSSMASN
jgi:hypothetical protein